MLLVDETHHFVDKIVILCVEILILQDLFKTIVP
jgi:hypothetical protein